MYQALTLTLKALNRSNISSLDSFIFFNLIYTILTVIRLKRFDTGPKQRDLKSSAFHLREDHEQYDGKAAAVHYHAHIQPVYQRSIDSWLRGDEWQIVRPRLPRKTASESKSGRLEGRVMGPGTLAS
jgi:hypothetical protein